MTSFAGCAGVTSDKNDPVDALVTYHLSLCFVTPGVSERVVVWKLDQQATAPRPE